MTWTSQTPHRDQVHALSTSFGADMGPIDAPVTPGLNEA